MLSRNVKKIRDSEQFCNKSNFKNAFYEQSVWIVFPQKIVIIFLVFTLRDQVEKSKSRYSYW